MPTSRLSHREKHLVDRVGWLRAAIMGANDGIVSTASLIVGVAAASVTRDTIVLAGVAGMVAGAMSMAAGEYVSVSSQSDLEKADIERETTELENDPVAELHELASIYRRRGLDRELAMTVAQQMTDHDALGAHVRDELGLSEVSTARPVQAAATSALTFALGAALPLGTAMIVPLPALSISVAVAALVALAILGGLGARAGGANVVRATLRVTFWGAFAMAITSLIGHAFDVMI